MNRITQLIDEHCPNGVELQSIDNLCDVFTGGEVPSDFIKSKKPEGDYIYPIYSNGINENALYGYAKTFRIAEDAVTFSSIGTLGHPSIRAGKFTPVIRLKVLIPKDKTKLNLSFLKYSLELADFSNNKSSVPNLNASMLKKIRIPVPPILVQEEIVRILDSFTELEAMLEAELRARKTQYEYYRDKLLTFKELEA